jgi:hypothetical protein
MELENSFSSRTGDKYTNVIQKLGAGEPNNANVGESCIALMNMAWWDGRWNDDVCSKEKHFICEL